MREPIDKPARRHARHPRADQRDALAAEEEAIIPVAERAYRESPARARPRFSLSGRALVVRHPFPRRLTWEF